MFRIASRLIQPRISQGRSRPRVSLGLFVIVVCSAIPASAQVIQSINPNSAVAGGPAFSLSVTGSGFNGPGQMGPNSQVRWNGSSAKYHIQQRHQSHSDHQRR